MEGSIKLQLAYSDPEKVFKARDELMWLAISYYSIATLDSFSNLSANQAQIKD